MSEIGHNFPPGDIAGIPETVQPDKAWTPLMLEMADHIGPYATLLLVARFGGQRIYIPADPDKGKEYEGRGTIRALIGADKAAILSHVYRREYLSIPTAAYALRRARRQGLIASVRAGDITGAEAARRVRTTRPYMSHLVNQTDEGQDPGELPGRRTGRIPGQMYLFDDDDDA
jgi:hypothetical protein